LHLQFLRPGATHTRQHNAACAACIQYIHIVVHERKREGGREREREREKERQKEEGWKTTRRTGQTVNKERDTDTDRQMNTARQKQTSYDQQTDRQTQTDRGGE